MNKKGKQYLIAGIMISLVLFISLVIAGSYTSSNKYDVTFEFTEVGMIHKCLDITIKNLQDSADNLDLKTILNETNFNINSVENIIFYEYKPEIVDMGKYTTTCNDNILPNGTIQKINCVNSFESNFVEQWNWKEKSLTTTDKEGSTEIRNTWEQIAIQKAGQQKDTKQFRMCFDTPIVNKNGVWGNSGTIYLNLNNEIFYDKTHSSWWNSNWIKRKAINITERSGAGQTDYSVNLSILYDTDMSVNYEDLRFTDSADANELGYWIETRNATRAIVWVKVPTLTASVNTTINMYYDNLTAVSTTSNLPKAFIYGDDFEAAAINETWVENDDINWFQEYGSLNVSVTAAGRYYLYLNETAYDYADMEATVMAKIMPFGVGLGLMGRYNYAADTLYDCYWYKTDSNVYVDEWLNNGYQGQIANFDATTMPYTYTKLTFRINGTSFYASTTPGVYAVGTDGTTASGTWGVRVEAGVGNASFDNYTLRPITYPEPMFFYGAEEAGGTIPPAVVKVSPTNTTYTPIITEFNLTVTDATGVDACLLSLNLATNVTMANDTVSNFYVKNSTMSQGAHTAYFYCNDTTNNMNATEMVTFEIDSLDSNLITPTSGSAIITSSQNFTANYTMVGGDLKNATYNVWYSNGTLFNQTTNAINGTTNETTLNIADFEIDSYKWNVLTCAQTVSETICEWDASNFTFIIGVSVGTETYSYWTYETSEQTFNVSLTLVEDTSLLSANLVYNNTNYAANISVSGNDYVLSRTIDTPLNPDYFTNDTNDFYWSFTYVDEDDAQTIQNTTTHQQNVTFLIMSICNSTYTSPDSRALNFTMYDELTKNLINASSNATTIKTTFDYWVGSGDVYKSYSYSNLTNSNETGNSYDFCIFPRNETLTVDMDMEYGAVDYTTRKYYLSNAQLDNSTNDIRLELLPTVESVKFFITVLDELVAFDNATVTISKYFVGEGVYRTTEIRETDNLGKFVSYLDLDQTYQFLIVKDGVSYGTVTKTATCEEAPCEMTLQIESASEDLWQGYDDIFASSVSYTLSYNDTTKNVTYTFSDLTGLAQSFALDVNKIEYDIESSIVYEPSGAYCNKTLAAVTGTLICDLNNYTKGDFKATGYIDRGEKKIVDYITFVISSIKDTLGLLGVFVSFLIIVVVGLAGIWNPAVGVVLVGFAILMMKLLGFVAFGWTTVILILIMAIILVFKIKS